MKKFYLLFFVALGFTMLPSCVSQGDYDSLKTQNDSIQARITELEDVTSVLANFVSCIDSLNELEINLKTTDDLGNSLSKAQVMANMQRYQDALTRQKETIAALKDSLSNSSIFVPLLSIIQYTNNQIASKEEQVKELQNEVATGKQKINTLNKSVSNLRDNVTQLEESARNQLTAIHLQEKKINQCYYLVCNKNTLKDNNLIETNMLGGNIKLQYGQFESHKDLFTKADRRDLDAIIINGKSPKLLTQAPQNSYEIKNIGTNEYKLEILDYNSFWNASDYLVILVK